METIFHRINRVFSWPKLRWGPAGNLAPAACFPAETVGPVPARGVNFPCCDGEAYIARAGRGLVADGGGRKIRGVVVSENLWVVIFAAFVSLGVDCRSD